MTLLEHLPDLLALAPSPGAPGVPDPGTGEAPPGVGDDVLTLLKWVAWLATAFCVGGFLWAGGQMAIAHRRGDDTNLSRLGWTAAGCIVVGSAAGIVGALI